MCVLQVQIFGPVAVAMPFRTAKEAVELANNTRYGLAASVWTENVSLGLEVALLLKAGSVWVNSHNLFDAAAGFGGYRQSGFGRDGGKEVCLFRPAAAPWVSSSASLTICRASVTSGTQAQNSVELSAELRTLDTTLCSFQRHLKAHLFQLLLAGGLSTARPAPL